LYNVWTECFEWRKCSLGYIYLDNAATTCVSVECAKTAYDAMVSNWGNPSSRHTLGMNAERLVNDVRHAVAAELSARDDEIFFTSGGTESNNLAILGAAYARRRTGKRIITSSVEHSSVLDSAAQLESEGFEVIRISPQSDGSIHIEDIADVLTPDTILLSFMLVNNETGAVTDVAGISRLLRRTKSTALLHCDAVQAFGKLPVNVNTLGCDLLSLSGHKIHAPKGVGALYRRKGVRILPIHFGGSQQGKLRPGTEPVPLIASLGTAVRNLAPVGKRTEHVKMLNDYCREKLLSDSITALADITINSPENSAPHIISFATGCIKSETLLNFFSERGIYVSSGSACSKGRASHVLVSLGLEPHIADSTIRVSFCDSNSTADIDAMTDALQEALKTLIRFR